MGNLFQKNEENILSPISWSSMLTPGENGTETGEGFQWINDYVWENHSNFYSLIRRYNILRNYEKNYNMTSEDLLNKWRANELTQRNEHINDWLTIYLQTKDFIK